MDFNENLRQVRMDRGVTQKSLSDALGVTPVTIGNWERGSRQPSFTLLLRLANALDVSVDELLGRSGGTTAYDTKTTAVANQFAALDEHGQELVKTVCSMEYERVRRNTAVVTFQQVGETRHTSKNRFLPKYISPPAAGFGVPLEGEDFEMIRVDDSVPVEADYAVCVAGDSMEPYIHDGDMVFVKETERLDEGDVGIFCVNGEMLCKQYHMDDQRNLHLLSINPARADASVHIPHDSGYVVRCCGKVLS